jgi:hypothetical protein
MLGGVSQLRHNWQNANLVRKRPHFCICVENTVVKKGLALRIRTRIFKAFPGFEKRLSNQTNDEWVPARRGLLSILLIEKLETHFKVTSVDLFELANAPMLEEMVPRSTFIYRRGMKSPSVDPERLVRPKVGME